MSMPTTKSAGHVDIQARGFTLVELLIAMAVTLIMMAALAKSFGFIGEQVRDGRAIVQLSAELRDITTRLHDDLERCTASLTPATRDYEPTGYFMYSEGPMTDATSSIFSSTQVIEGQAALPHSRYGDIDDYLAFTAVAKPGNWFTGKVPTYIFTGISTDTALQVIRSKYAEIVYFTNPDRDSTGAVIDADGNGLPDRLNLYRRVLLIRPDLNLNGSNALNVLTLAAGTGNVPGPGTWQTALAPVHQLCDLSIRRGLNANGTYGTSIVANSLEDLSKPHNRFAHVRVTAGALAGGASTTTSMPVLALEPPVQILTNASSSSTPPLRPTSTSTAAGVGASVELDSRWGGYLRREFVLSGARQGEDVVANNCRGLDIQIYDPGAEFRVMQSSTNLVVGPSDSGYREALREVGTTASPTFSITGGFVDLCYPVLAGGPMRGWEEMLVAQIANTANIGNDAFDDSTNTVEVDISRFNTPFSGINERLSGTTSYPATANPLVYSDSLMKSGRVYMRSGTASRILLFQPTFDTYTNSYERDGFPQDNRSTAGTSSYMNYGTVWDVRTATSTQDLAADGIDNNSGSLAVGIGADDFTEQETSAPFTQTPEAIRVSVRLESLANRQLRQQSVTYSGSSSID